MKKFVGFKDEFKNYECKVLMNGKKRILVWKSNEEFFATLDLCPHQGVSLRTVKLTGTLTPSKPKEIEPGMEGYVLRCPWHKWEFDVRTGKALFGTETKCIKTYQVLIEGDEVYVDI